MTVTSTGSVIDIERVRMVYQSNRGEVPALDDVSLAVGTGEFVSIVGPSGCGKTTLLKIVAGLKFPTSGTVKIRGETVRGPQRNAGMVFQSPALMPWRTVLGNIMLQAEIRGLDRGAYRSKAFALLELVGLTGFENRYPYELSGGMQQRASICRALIHDPALLLMDEPFGALDALSRERMSLELQRVWIETQKTVMFITHSIPEAVFLSDRVAVMSARPGRMLRVVDVPIRRPRTLDTMASPDFASRVSEIRRVMHANGGLD